MDVMKGKSARVMFQEETGRRDLFESEQMRKIVLQVSYINFTTCCFTLDVFQFFTRVVQYFRRSFKQTLTHLFVLV